MLSVKSATQQHKTLQSGFNLFETKDLFKGDKPYYYSN